MSGFIEVMLPPSAVSGNSGLRRARSAMSRRIAAAADRVRGAHGRAPERSPTSSTGAIRTGADATRLKLEVARGQNLVVPGVESRLVQVFRNLLANAASFSPPRGEIALKVFREGRFVVATVEDQGPGIPEGKQQAIFDRFYSERPAGEKFGTHSGLGLSISKQIVDAHLGVIRAENRIAPDGQVEGARFIVKLPVD